MPHNNTYNGITYDPDNISFGPDANCTLANCPVEWSVYQYRPSLAANGTFIGLFAIAMGVHFALGFRWRNWWFSILVMLGCVAEIIGYAGRIMLYYNPFFFVGFMIQIVLITIAPVFPTAAIYVTLSKTIENLNPSISRLPPRVFYYFFIPADIACLTLQAISGAMSTDSKGNSWLGVHLGVAGLSLQLGFLAIFCGFFVDYVVRYVRSVPSLPPRMKAYFGFLAAACVFILLRCSFRVDELSEGYFGHLIHSQGLFIGLEGVPIVLAVFCLCIGNPGLAFSKRGKGDVETVNSHDVSQAAMVERK